MENLSVLCGFTWTIYLRFMIVIDLCLTISLEFVFKDMSESCWVLPISAD